MAGGERLVAAADVLTATAARLDGFRSDIGDPVPRAFAGWHGTAAPVAAGRLSGDLAVLAGAAQACRAVAPGLRMFAEELERAQRDATDAAADPELGADIAQSTADRLGFAADDAARAVREATALLPELVDAEGGTVLDGLRRAGGDVLDELGSTLSGALDHVNPFSDRFGEAWSATGATVTAAVTDPAGALSTVVDGVTAPIADSYRTGGVDEAAGRGVGTIAAALLGGKGVTKLAKLVPDPVPGPSGIAPPEFTRPQTRLAPNGGLRRHEEFGGHTLDPGRAHVGATDQQLLDRQAREKRPLRVSTFTDRRTAEIAVAENLRRNRARVDAWLNDDTANAREAFRWDHRDLVGRSAPKLASLDDVVGEHRSTVVLRKDPSAPDGYYVLSAYPGM